MDNCKNPIDAISSFIAETKPLWLKCLGKKVLEVKRELLESEIEDIYKILITETGLETSGREENDSRYRNDEDKPYEPNNATADVKNIELISLTHVKGVNAVAESQRLDFNPNLTVIFGYNGTGKSGYVRILKRVSNSRTVENIWGNIHEGNALKNKGSAKFELRRDGTVVEIDWTDGAEIDLLTRLEVFDNKCVKVFVTEKLEFNFKPYGFELFSYFSEGIKRVNDRLERQISIHEANLKDFSNVFNQETQTNNLISNLSFRTSKDVIEKQAELSDGEKKKIDELIKRKKDLETTNIENKIKLIDIQITKLRGLILSLRQVFGIFKNDEMEKFAFLVKSYQEIREKVEEQEKVDLTKHEIPSLGSEEWKTFIKAADEYIKILPNSKQYPDGHDKCVYCRQKLSDAAVELLKAYKKVLSSESASNLKKIEGQISSKCESIKQIDFIFSPEDLSVLNERFEKAEKGLLENVKQMAEVYPHKKNEIIQGLISREWKNVEFNYDECLIQKVEVVLEDLVKEKNKLKADRDNREKLIKETTKELNELSDRQKLSEIKEQIVKHLDNLIWIKKAKELNSGISPRPVTILSKKVWDSIVTEEFKKKFEDDRKRLDAPKIDFNFPGEYGTTKREKTIHGFEKIDDILSEGEQKSIALADFLAEVGTSKQTFPIIFDDPVTSFDHLRRKKIAERFVEESMKRQVIIFTHDILFLNYLKEAAEIKEANCSFHWIDTDGHGLFGKVSLNDSPALESLKHRKKKVRECIESARNLVGGERLNKVREGYNHLRPAYENLVIEKVFKGVCKRFSEKIQMLNLKKVKYDPVILEKVQDKFEEVSRFIDPHSHSDISQQDLPTIERLQQDLDYLENMEKFEVTKQITVSN